MFLMTFAIVNVLPEPVTPNRVWYFSPASTPWVSLAMACGWSPRGWYLETSLKSATGTMYHKKFRTNVRHGD